MSLLMSTSCSELMMQGPTEDHSHLWSIVVTEYDFLKGAIFIANSQDGKDSNLFRGGVASDNVFIGPSL